MHANILSFLKIIEIYIEKMHHPKEQDLIQDDKGPILDLARFGNRGVQS